MMADGADDPMGMPSQMTDNDADDQQTPPPDPAMAAGPQGGGGGDMPAVSPEALNYHDDPRSCAPAGQDGSPGCQYFQGGNCQILQMQVSGPGSCNAFVALSGGEDQSGGLGDMSTGADQTQNPDGTSGGPSLS
jgi:hypothetical protein